MDHAWEPSLIPPCNRNAYNNDEEQNLEVELRNGAINGTSSIVDDEQQNTAGQEHSRIGQKFLFSLSSISISTEGILITFFVLYMVDRKLMMYLRLRFLSCYYTNTSIDDMNTSTK